VKRKQDYQAYLQRLAYHDLENCHVEDEFDDVNFQNLTEHYGRNQGSNPHETQYGNA
jgi:hypothetical protein